MTPLPKQRPFPGDPITTASPGSPLLWLAMLTSIPFLMVAGIAQIQSFPYPTLQPYAYVIGFVGGAAATYFYARFLHHRSFVVTIRGKETRLSVPKIVFSLVLTFCGSTLLIGAGSWMLVGDVIVFTSKEEHKYVSRVIGLGYGGRGCRSGSVSFYDPYLRNDVTLCGDSFIEHAAIEDTIQVQSKSGPFGVRIVSFKRVEQLMPNAPINTAPFGGFDLP